MEKLRAAIPAAIMDLSRYKSLMERYIEIASDGDMLKKEYKEVLMYLNKGYSIRVTSKLTNVSVATIQRLKNEFIRSA